MLETANRYGYLDGNPINYVDPTGLNPICVGYVVECLIVIAKVSDVAMAGSSFLGLSAASFLPVVPVAYGGASIAGNFALEFETQVGGYMNSMSNAYGQGIVQNAIWQTQQFEAAEYAAEQAQIWEGFNQPTPPYSVDNLMLDITSVAVYGTASMLLLHMSVSNLCGTALMLALNNMAPVVILETRWIPRTNNDWNEVARSLGIDRNTLSRNLHSCKRVAGVPNNGNVQVDDETGDISHRGEHIGNLYDGC